MVEILTQTCIGCGRCVADCFPRNLFLSDGKAHVKRVCMECGHCFTVCPTGAVRISGYPEDGVMELKDAPAADGEALLALIKSRRSIRRYQDRPVPDEVIARVLEAGRFTPTGGNRQDVRYVVVRAALPRLRQLVWESLERLLESEDWSEGPRRRYRATLRLMARAHRADPANDGLFFSAPALLLVLSSAPLDGALAASTVELMAHAQGLGALFSGFIHTALAASGEACALLDIDPAQLCACLLLGYPDVTYRRTVPRKSTQVRWL